MSSRPKAWVVHQPMRRSTRQPEKWVPAIDVSPASQYGDLTFVVDIPERPSLDPEAYLPIIRTKLKEFRVDDYLVLVGDLNLVVYAAALAMQQTGGHINLLKWHPTDHCYVSMSADVFKQAA